MILYLDCVPMKQNLETTLPECAETPEEFMIVLKQHRNVMLNQTDWRVGVDSPLTDLEKQEWVEYRKYLRNITDNLPPVLSNSITILDPPTSGGLIRVMGRTPS
jgi:hypothetical protein